MTNAQSRRQAVRAPLPSSQSPTCRCEPRYRNRNTCRQLDPGKDIRILICGQTRRQIGRGNFNLQDSHLGSHLFPAASDYIAVTIIILQMGTFAETANVDYRLSFADQEKQTSVFRFPFSILQQSKGSCRFPYIYKNTYIHVFIYAVVSNGKRTCPSKIYKYIYIYIDVFSAHLSRYFTPLKRLSN